MDIFDLAAKITLDSSEYERGIEEAERSGSAFGDKIKGALANGAKVTTAAVAALGTGTLALGAAFVSATDDVATYGDEIDKASQKLGFSAEKYQEWDAVLQHSGTSISAAQASIRTLSKAAQNGAEEFDRLGISQEEAAKMSNEQLWETTIEALQNVEDETERTHLAQTLLGRGAMEMGALLNTSAKDTQAMKDRVHELGGVMSNEAVKAAANYKDKLQDLKTSISGVKNSIVSDFLPGVSEVMDGLTEIFSGDPDKGIGLISDGIDSIIEKLGDKAPEIMETGGQIVINIGQSIISNLPKLTGTGSRILLELSGSIIDSLPQIFAAGTQIITELVTSLSQAAPDLIPAAADAVAALFDGLVQNADTLLAAGLDLMVSLATGFADAAPKLVEKLPEIAGKLVKGVITNADEFAKAGLKIIEAIGVGVFKSIGGLIESIVSELSGSREIADNLEAVSSKITPFQEALNKVKPDLAEYGSLVSSAGHSLSELDQAIKDSEDKITEILKGAAQDNRELRQEEIDELTEHNDKLRGLWNEKIGIYRDTQVAELRKIQLEANNISQEMAAQYLVDAEAALDEANKISDQWYTQDITQIENLHRTTQITDQEYAARLQRAKEDNDDRLAENARYYQETVSAIQAGGRQWVESEKEAWGNVRKASAESLVDIKDDTESNLRAWQKSTKTTLSDYSSDLSQVDVNTAKAFLNMLISVREKGGQIDEESKATAEAILSAYDNLPGSLQEAGAASLRGLVEGMGDRVSDLQDTSEMSAQEIVDILSRELDLGPIGSGAAGDLASGISSRKDDVRTSAKGLKDAANDGTSGMQKAGKTAGENYGDGLKSGIDAKARVVYESAAAIARAANYAVKNTLQIASPSKVAIGLGKFFGEGIAIGVENGIPEVEKAAKEMSDALKDPIEAPEITYSAPSESGDDTRGAAGILQQLLGAISELKDGLQITVMLDDGTLISRIDTGLGTIAQRKARGN